MRFWLRHWSKGYILLKWYQEPFLHFMVLGTFLFFIIEWNSPENREESSRVIVVKQEDIDRVVVS